MNLDRSLHWKQEIDSDGTELSVYERFAGDGEEAVFNEYSDFILFTACLGFQKGEREEYSSDSAIRMSSILSDDLKKVMSRSLAYADTGDIEAIDDIVTQSEAIGEYAVSGAKIADEEIGNDELLDTVVDYLRENRDKDKEEKQRDILKEIKNHWE
jgi:hypothetical protein